MLVRRVAAGTALVWEDTRAILITQRTPENELVIWLCAGKLEQVLELSRDACFWAEGMGCTRAHFTGRRGWGRVPAIREDGWVMQAPDHFTKEIHHAEERKHDHPN